MTVELETAGMRHRGRWWQRGWIWLAMVILAAEVGAVWLLSARGVSTRAPLRSVTPRYRMAPDLEGTPGAAQAQAWNLLMSPAVMLMPSADDFSGSSWLAGPRAEVALEAFLARTQPLPFESIRGPGGGLGLYPRLDPGPGSRWDLPGGMGPLPQVAPVALLADGRVRILEGFEGWRLEREIRLDPLPGGLLAQRAVVRLMIDGAGAPATPPLIWESSGEAVADAAALDVVGRLQLAREGVVGAASGTGDRRWGFIEVTWPAPKDAPPPQTKGRP